MKMIKKRNIAYIVLFILLVSGFLGCVQKQPETATPIATPIATPTATPQKTPETEITGLAPDGKVIYKYITENKYQSWKMWPGKEALYPPNPPKTHGAAFMTTYVNDVALSAIESKAGKMQEDSVIVKENYDANKTLAALTVMFKEDGYDPEHNDWFYAKYAPNGTIQAEGKVKGCIDCHAQAKDKDYLFNK